MSKTLAFHLLVPASAPEGNLCKNVFSSTLLRYPTPIIINWGRTYDNDTLASGGSHLGKISGVLDHLKTLEVAQDDDMVLIVDGYDIWFQLPPSVLVSRYNAIIKKAEKRLREDFGKEGLENSNIRQSIVFSSQKKCWPGGYTDAHCWAVPLAQLPSDLYGSDTDVDIRSDGDDTYIVARHRQRYLNSGILMGPAADMRAMFARALELAEEDPGSGSDQAIFAKIFGAQEYARTLKKEECQASRETTADPSSSSGDRPTQSISGDAIRAIPKPPSILDPHPTRKQLDLDANENYEFGVNLDYESTLGQPTVFADFDLDWITYNDTESLASARAKNNISHTLPGSDSLDDDLLHTPGPFAPFSYSTHLSGAPFQPSPISPSSESDESSVSSSNTSWADVPLFNNLWTGITPAIIHHNAHRDGLKANRERMWDRIWFQPHARELLMKRLEEGRSVSPIAETEGVRWVDSDGDENKPAGFVFKTDREEEKWISWNEICDQGMQEEVFRDGKGMLDVAGSDGQGSGQGNESGGAEEKDTAEE